VHHQAKVLHLQRHGRGLFAKGGIVRTPVCDGDTKALEWVKEQGPAEVVAVISSDPDLNHVAKAMGAKLRDLMALWKGELMQKHCDALQKAHKTRCTRSASSARQT